MISEGIGRKKTLLIGLTITLAGALLCLFAKNIHMLQIGRFVQGCGAGACTGLWRSILRDNYSGKAMAKMGGTLSNLMIFSIITAPFLGGYLSQYFGWRADFKFLSTYTLLILILITLFFKETGKHHHVDRLRVKFILTTYLEILKSKLFIGCALASLFTYGAVFTWIMQSPILLIHSAGLSPVSFGHLTLLTGLIIFLGNSINKRLLDRFSGDTLLQAGWTIMFFAGLILLIGHFYFEPRLWFLVTFLPALILIFGASFVWTSITAKAFLPFGHIAGYAGGLYSSIQILGGVIFGSILAKMNSETQLPVSLLILICIALAWVSFRALAYRRI
jgi:DHA1 family bicyclomycin/chloramphenicol resistance-like MFS transporter/DHA1 family 2-module integral membrane pump EmrD-like MFS transporter